MNARSTRRPVLVYAIFAVTLVGCVGIGKSGGDGLMSAVNAKADVTGAKLASGARDILTNDETRQKLTALEQTLVAGLRDPLTSEETARKIQNLQLMVMSDLRAQLKETEQKLLDDSFYTSLARAREELIGAKTAGDVEKLRNVVIGPETQAAIAKMAADALGDATQARVGALRDELIGDKAKTAVNALITESLKTLGEQFDQNLRPRLASEEAALKAKINQIIVVAALAVLAVLGVAWFFRHRAKEDRSILNVITNKIDEIPDQVFYDRLTRAISRSSKELGIEARLRRILAEQGINPESAAVPATEAGASP